MSRTRTGIYHCVRLIHEKKRRRIGRGIGCDGLPEGMPPAAFLRYAAAFGIRCRETVSLCLITGFQWAAVWRKIRRSIRRCQNGIPSASPYSSHKTPGESYLGTLPSEASGKMIILLIHLFRSGIARAGTGREPGFFRRKAKHVALQHRCHPRNVAVLKASCGKNAKQIFDLQQSIVTQSDRGIKKLHGIPIRMQNFPELLAPLQNLFLPRKRRVRRGHLGAAHIAMDHGPKNMRGGYTLYFRALGGILFEVTCLDKPKAAGEQ